MKSLTQTAIVALTAGIIGIIGIAGAVPAAMAQQQPAQGPGQGQQTQPHMQRPGFGHFNIRPNMRPQMGNTKGRGEMQGGLLALVCSDRGAERLEISFVRLSHRLDPTAEQAPLFDDLKATALAAQTQFADSCKAARPSASANAATPLDPVAGMRALIDLDKARLAALESVLPKFEAFYGSLTDAQKAALAPRGNGRSGNHRPGMGMMQPNLDQPGAMQPEMNSPATPATPPAPGGTQG